MLLFIKDMIIWDTLYCTQENYSFFDVCTTVKPVLSSHSKKDKTKVLMANGSLMKVNTFDLH